MNKIVLGIFASTEEAQDAIENLKSFGLEPQDVSVIMRNQGKAKVISEGTGAKVVSGGATGIVTGAVLGGVAGFLVATGVLAVPGLGAIFVAGPVATALGLTGTAATTMSGAATGAVAGGILGVLTGLGLSENDVKVYEKHIQEGGILVIAPSANDQLNKVKRIYLSCGAVDVKVIENQKLHVHESENYPVHSSAF
ncbi:MAG TPA: general stress protein [Patescibacteria group bacterium]|nr:general stress protein [Patescibacteria group bacterium]